MKRTLTADERQQLQPAVTWLMSEAGHNLTEGSAWDIATDPKKALRFLEGQFAPKVARHQAVKAVSLNETQAGLLRASDARALPNSTIQSIRPKRAANGPVQPFDGRKPSESDLDYQRRIERQVAALARPAGRARALPSDDTSSSYAEVRQTRLNDPVELAREVARTASRGTPAPSTADLTDRAHRLMKARGEAVFNDRKTLAAQPAAIKQLYGERLKLAMGELV